MPDEDFTAMVLVDYQWSKVLGGEELLYFVFEYDFGGNYVLTYLTRQKTGDEYLIAGLNWKVPESSVTEVAKFDFKDKGGLHYVFLLGVVLLPIFSIWMLVFCIRTKELKRKWLWCLYIVIGMAEFQLNWSTGEVELQLLNFQLLSASASASGVAGPWMLGCSMPVGAIAFLNKRKKLKAQRAESKRENSLKEI